MPHLSTREAEVLDCRAQGLPYKLVASELDISINTVKMHISRALRKLQSASCVEANLKRQKPIRN